MNFLIDINDEVYLQKFLKMEAYYNSVVSKLSTCCNHAIRCSISNPVPLSGIESDLPEEAKKQIVMRAASDLFFKNRSGDLFFAFDSKVTRTADSIVVSTSNEEIFSGIVLKPDDLPDRDFYRISRFYRDKIVVFSFDPEPTLF
jgi:hypothetical protein